MLFMVDVKGFDDADGSDTYKNVNEGHLYPSLSKDRMKSTVFHVFPKHPERDNIGINDCACMHLNTFTDRSAKF